jgi:hypothetical protein
MWPVNIVPTYHPPREDLAILPPSTKSFRNLNPSPNIMGIKDWTNDSLHNLLGFADSALASYLIHVASKGDADAVLRTLKEGGVDVDAKGAWKEFASELVARSRNKGAPARSGGGGGGATASGGKRVTESDMRKKAAGYSLLEMQDDDAVGECVLCNQVR